MPPAGGGVMNCGSRVLRLLRGAGGSGSRTSDWDPNGPSQSSTRPILLFFFDRFGRACRGRREPGRPSSFAGRRSGGRWSCWIVELESLPQPLQFEDQRLALRRRGILIRSPEPAARATFIGMHVIKTLHDETLSASDGRCSALACGAGCGDPGTPLPPALRTRANTSALGPNAIALPS